MSLKNAIANIAVKFGYVPDFRGWKEMTAIRGFGVYSVKHDGPSVADPAQMLERTVYMHFNKHSVRFNKFRKQGE
jgi:hypothetical protein